MALILFFGKGKDGCRRIRYSKLRAYYYLQFSLFELLLEAMLGPTTVVSQSWGETRGVSSSGFSSSRSVSQQETGRSLLTAAEIRQLPFDSALVLTAGGAPILASKLGVPQPSLPIRVWQTAVAHRETSATLAAAALVGVCSGYV